ncbi:MAG: enoyl-CoA hydratase/isomerase family protein [Candidatus Hodarchaeota archaeon]
MESEIVKLEYIDSVCIMSLNRGVTNAINLQLVKEISKKLQMAREKANIHSIVLTSSNEKFFAIGFDIPELLQLNKEQFKEFYTEFNKLSLDLYTFPKPVVAALTGHAIAGGCILALCCDYRFIADGKKLMGLNEIKLGVPVPYVADCILRQLVGLFRAREITDIGDFYLPEKLMQLGLVDEIFPINDLVKKSVEKARLLGVSQEAFNIIKRNRVEILASMILESLTEKEIAFIECWYSSESRKLLQEAVEKF